jgi:hypothetical protein
MGGAGLRHIGAEIMLVAWQQLLRSEKLFLRKASWRVLKRGRKHLKRRWLKKQSV